MNIAKQLKNLALKVKNIMELSRSKIISFVANAKAYLQKFTIFRLAFALKKKSEESVLIFGLLLVAGNVSFVVTRGFGIWYLDLGHQYNIYLISVVVSCLISLLLIFLKYLQINNYLSRFKENKKRLKMYDSYLISKKKAKLNIGFKHTGRLWVLIICISYSLFFLLKIYISVLFIYHIFIILIFLSA